MSYIKENIAVTLSKSPFIYSLQNYSSGHIYVVSNIFLSVSR